jgi:hypothetical protein
LRARGEGQLTWTWDMEQPISELELRLSRWLYCASEWVYLPE